MGDVRKADRFGFARRRREVSKSKEHIGRYLHRGYVSKYLS